MQNLYSNSKLLSTLAHETHVWLARPQLFIYADRIADFLAHLDPAERRKYHRFIFDKDRHHFLSAHILVRTAPSQYVNISPKSWKFTANKYGRPEIASEIDAPPLRFNLSHTNGLVACVISYEIDAELMPKRSDPCLVIFR